MRSLSVVLVIAVAVACVVAFPIIGFAALTSPASVAIALGTVALGAAVVALGMLSTRPTLRAVLAEG